MKTRVLILLILILSSATLIADVEMEAYTQDLIIRNRTTFLQEISKKGPGAGYYDVRSQLQNLVYSRTQAALDVGAAARDSITNAKELEARVNEIRAKFIASVGGLPSSDTPLNAKITGIIEEPGLTIEKIIFNSRPNVYVTANLYKPTKLKGKTGAVLFLCGHNINGKGYGVYQSVCRTIAKAGLIVMSIDPVGQGERVGSYERVPGIRGIRWGVKEHNLEGIRSTLMGDSIARYFVHDAIRAIDYLQTRPDVNKDKIGVTGNSGGGTQTALVMICDKRIAAAAPATFIMDYASHMQSGNCQDLEQIWPKMAAYGFDHEDVLLAMCPKPVRVLTVKYDFFPIEGAKRTVDRSSRIWKMMNKPENLDMIEDDSVHKYTTKLMSSAAEFFAYHLNGSINKMDEISVTPITNAQLRCTQTGRVIEEIKDSANVYNESQLRLNEVNNNRKSLMNANNKKYAFEWLRATVSSDRKPCDFNMRIYNSINYENYEAKFILWWSQKGIMNHAVMIREYRLTDKDIPVVAALWNGGIAMINDHASWIWQKCSEGKAVVIFEPTGVGSLLPNSPLTGIDPLGNSGVISSMHFTLMQINDSITAMRTWDTLRFVELLPQLPNVDETDISYETFGRYGVYFKLAKALNPNINNLKTNEFFGSYTDLIKERNYDTYDVSSIILPDCLKYFDFDELN